MGFPQNPVVVLSSLSAAAAAVGALKRWTRGRGQRCIPEEEEAEKSVLVDQVKEAANVGESQVWLTSQVNCSEAVKGEWDDESSRKVAVNSVAVQGKGRDDASLQKEVADCGEGGEDGVSSQEEGMGLPKFLFKAQQDDLALAGRELDQEARSTHARWGLEGPVQQDKMNAALLAAVPPQDELAESHKTPKKERYVDIEAEKDRGESPERTPTSVLKIFPDSPESNSGELSFPGPMRGGGRGTAWTRGPIFGDRPSDTLEGGLLPLFVQLGKVGGDKGRHALNLGAGGLDDTSERRDHEGGRVGCTMGGARRTQSDGGVVGFGKRSRAAQFAERQLSLQISVHVSAGESEEPGSDSSSAPHAEAAVSKPGGNKQGEAQPRVGESADETVRGAQKSLFDEGDRGTAYQGEGRQGMPREGKDLLAERRQSGEMLPRVCLKSYPQTFNRQTFALICACIS